MTVGDDVAKLREIDGSITREEVVKYYKVILHGKDCLDVTQEEISTYERVALLFQELSRRDASDNWLWHTGPT